MYGLTASAVAAFAAIAEASTVGAVFGVQVVAESCVGAPVSGCVVVAPASLVSAVGWERQPTARKADDSERPARADRERRMKGSWCDFER
jgi:hypothetical protein